MALIKCKECGNEISKKASVCPQCGSPAKKKTSPLTWAVAIIFFGAIYVSSQNDKGGSGTTSSTAKVKASTYQVSKASYREVNDAVGCDSKYSDDKKDDIFQSNYKNHWMTWKGIVVLSESGSASLNIDGSGIQDLQVDFANSKDGYDLNKDTTITVKFLMKRAGGCFLPFSGDKAIIL